MNTLSTAQQPARKTTLLNLLVELREKSVPEHDLVDRARALINSRQVVLSGNFAGQLIAPC